ncbi:ParB/RepB/Spo0J family partition protein [Caballeronia sp. LP003]|uniref:ParB/RepB/Spo0J family partition protein n=1 Tax=Caballeronia sp. LP003 TaxID=3038551 RepID=UPI00285B5C3F|nr:ParB/RepB/Spo0J family partition protein [Caballeronia sp. LP003]MDR5785241.1 ParB/RepB/Spo0J family partition protein [Caballeronia sp. LP003]
MDDRNDTIDVHNDMVELDGAAPLPTVLESTFGGESAIEQVALSRLSASPRNVRRKVPTGIDGLADSIAAKGLLQNLVAHPMTGARGKKPKLCVCAGQRRLAALHVLAERGVIGADQLIPVKVVTEAEAIAASLIENHAREPMHSADQAMAFRMLIEEGKSADYIAALFSVPVLTVQRRLKIANVSPKLLDVFRDDGMTIEQVVALALTDDHGLQESLWFDAAQSWLRDPHQIRAAITQEEIQIRNNPLVAFVTLDAYEAAGGFVRRDLFSDDENAGYISDAALLQQLATDRLVEVAQTISAEGWKWVETRVKRDYSELSAYGRLSSHIREMTKREATEFVKLKKVRDAAIDALNAYYDDESEADAQTEEQVDDREKRDALDDAATAASEACDAFIERLETWTPEQLASGGAFVFLSYDGEVLVERGYLKPEDKPTREQRAAHASGTLEPEQKAKPVHSEKLCRRLTAHRTAAVQVKLAAQPNVALAVLMHHMIPTVFAEHYGHEYSGRTLEAKFTCVHGNLMREADDLADSRAWKEIEAERAKWTAMLPDRSAALLPWLLEQSNDITSNLFAFCVAATLDSVSATDSAHAVNALCDVLNLDMTKYWSATQASYLNHVSKGRIAEVVTVAVSAEAAAPLVSNKKHEAASMAERLLANTGWLPEVLVNRDRPQDHRFGSYDAEEQEADDEDSRGEVNAAEGADESADDSR